MIFKHLQNLPVDFYKYFSKTLIIFALFSSCLPGQKIKEAPAVSECVCVSLRGPEHSESMLYITVVEECKVYPQFRGKQVQEVTVLALLKQK